MSSLVYRMNHLLGQVVRDVPLGTNLDLYLFLWMRVSSRLLPSRGGIFPGLAHFGLPVEAVRRCGGGARLREVERERSDPTVRPTGHDRGPLATPLVWRGCSGGGRPDRLLPPVPQRLPDEAVLRRSR